MTSIERVELGPDGPMVPRLVVGGARMLRGHDTASATGLVRFIEKSLDLGLDWFDHADIYGDYRTEQHFGTALQQLGDRRHDVRIATKCGIQKPAEVRPSTRVRHYDTSPEHIRNSVDQSLTNFARDRLDLLLLHRPDPLFDAPAVATTLDALIREGKVAHVGVSNFAPAQLDMLRDHMKVPVATNQVEHSLAHTSPLVDGTFDQCQRLGVRPMLWSPLGADRILGEKSPVQLRTRLAELAATYQTEPAILVLAWALHHPTKPVAVVGTTRAERLARLDSAVSLQLDRQDWFDLYQRAIGRPIV